MSLAYFIISNDPNFKTEVMTNGKTLALNMDSVSVAGKDAGLPRLDSYLSQTKNEVIEFMKSSGIDDFDESTIPDEKWYTAKDGIEIFDKYIKLISEYEYISKSKKPSIISELQELKSVLVILDERGLKWHLGIDY